MGNKVLIVEDGPVFSFQLQRMLKNHGFQVVKPFFRGEDAVEYILEKPVDLILMDIMLAGEIDGIRTAEIISQHIEVPIIFLTALSDDETLKRAKLAIPYAFLIKPVEERALITTIDSVINKHRENLAKRKQEKERISMLIRGQEMERERMSREIHDGLGQILNAIKINIDYVKNNKKDISLLTPLLDEAIAETSRISEALMPSRLAVLPLEDCLEGLVHEMNGKAELHFHHNAIPRDIPDQVKLHVYRIVQELISNIEKHAEARHASVQLYFERGMLSLTVEDDGKGFDLQKNAQKKTGGHGLVNLKDRAYILGGTFKIESSKKFGTMINIEVPVYGKG